MDNDENKPRPRRKLRAVLAADIANFSGRVSVSETRAYGFVSSILNAGREELDSFGGLLLGIPGDGLFALFESATDAVHCALAIQQRLTDSPDLGGMKLRIGVHVGDVLFEDDTPFGETLSIGARLESLAEPGGILVSGTVFDVVSSRVAASFEPKGTPALKNIPRRIPTYSVKPALPRTTGVSVAGEEPVSPLDRTMELSSALTKFPEVRVPKPPNTVAATPPPTEQIPRNPQPQSQTSEPPASKKSFVISDATKDRIVVLAAKYLGPIAKVIVGKYCASASTKAELLENIVREVPNPGEQARFKVHLIEILSAEPGE